MKYILFLGGNGFLGKNVLDHYYEGHGLAEDIHFVVVGATKPIAPDNIPSDRLSYHTLDFSDKAALELLFKIYTFSEVFHFVSATVPANSNQEMSKDIGTNLLGTIGLLELMVQYGATKIMYMSSGGAIYGDSMEGGSEETDFNNPNNSYGIVKLTIEKYILLFSKLHGLDYLIFRLSNPFGPHHTSSRNGIVNIAIRKAIRKEPVVIWGDGLNTKDYIYAKDFAGIFWMLYEKDIKNQILNVGSGKVYSIIDILENIKKIIPDLHWTFEAPKSFDTKKVAFKLDALKSILDIQNTEFLTALKETYDWELSNTAEPINQLTN